MTRDDRASSRFDPDRLDARDAALIDQLLPHLEVFNRRYFHLRVAGLEHVPARPALFVSNHNGGIAGPDLLCTLATLWRARTPHVALHPLAHDFAMRQFTPLGRVLQRFGAVRACPANATRALAAGANVLVYPGGDLDAYRPYARRNEIVWGARSGFVRVAQRARVPIVPIVAHGAHRSAFILTDGARLARWIALERWARLERFPIALALPWGVALGPWIPYLPLPFPITLSFLPPVAVAQDDDPDEVREHVRGAMQRTLDGLAAAPRR